jgi:hypothetical protein
LKKFSGKISARTYQIDINGFSNAFAKEPGFAGSQEGRGEALTCQAI